MRNNPNVKTMVILTNGTIDKPLEVFDGYDARSEIENSMFREAKQAWFVQRAPKNTMAGFRSHVYITVLTMALTTAFKDWLDQQNKLEKIGEDTGVRKFREQIPPPSLISDVSLYYFRFILKAFFCISGILAVATYRLTFHNKVVGQFYPLLQVFSL